MRGIIVQIAFGKHNENGLTIFLGLRPFTIISFPCSAIMQNPTGQKNMFTSIFHIEIKVTKKVKYITINFIKFPMKLTTFSMPSQEIQTSNKCYMDFNLALLN